MKVRHKSDFVSACLGLLWKRLKLLEKSLHLGADLIADML